MGVEATRYSTWVEKVEAGVARHLRRHRAQYLSKLFEGDENDPRVQQMLEKALEGGDTARAKDRMASIIREAAALARKRKEQE